jgi:death-on-curing protein
MPLVYISIEQALEIHRKTVEISGGGSTGILDHGKLESVLANIQNDDYYPEFTDKITHLFFCANKFHCFQDGNKRIAITLAAQFLLLNGYMYCVGTFFQEMENISYHLAAGKISKELLHAIVDTIINESYCDNEDLKLQILHSIQE